MKTRFALLLFLAINGPFMTVHAGTGKTPAAKKPAIDTTKFVLVEGGTFKMGTNQPVERGESPEHNVTVASFYLSKTEVTFEDFDKYTKAIGRDTVTSGSWGRGKQPVFMVSWNDAVEYCNWLSAQEKLSKYYIIKDGQISISDTAKGYRLPTEAEWEFAAKGGNKSKGLAYAGSDDLSAVAWFKDNSAGQSHKVAQKAANELGLYDMAGNLWEWVWDIYDENYYKQPEAAGNPKGPASGPYRVMRGGAWYNDPTHVKPATRQNAGAGFRQNSVGFRVARNYW